MTDVEVASSTEKKNQRLITNRAGLKQIVSIAPYWALLELSTLSCSSTLLTWHNKTIAPLLTWHNKTIASLLTLFPVC
jgi:hypothetical protein